VWSILGGEPGQQFRKGIGGPSGGHRLGKRPVDPSDIFDGFIAYVYLQGLLVRAP
jgi:hypothetical protein